MAALDNAKHELFAQALARGSNQEDAYSAAGFEATGDAARSGASRLLTNANIEARVKELQARAAIRTEVTVADITRRLLAIATKGETSTEAPMLSVGRAALMDAAKLNGLVVDKADVNHSGIVNLRSWMTAAKQDD